MKKRWFTLIEMLIVIVIIGILAWALIPRIWSARDKANDVAREANVKSYATALSSYWADKWGYPKWADSLNTGNVFKSEYWLTTSLDSKPTANDTYHYYWLNEWTDYASHFVVCIKLSDGNEGWNFKVQAATWAYTTFTWVWAAESSTWNFYCSFM